MRQFIFTLTILLSTNILHAQQTSVTADTINQTDDRGYKQGFWKKIYQNGAIAYEGYFKDNKPIGEFKRYDLNGTLQVILFHKENSNIVYAKMIYPNGNIQAEGKYINQLKDSIWTLYSEKGKIIDKVPYQMNQKHGTEYKYYESGKIASKIEWKYDVLDGAWEQYHRNSKISIKMFHMNGVREGVYTVYSESGRKIIEGSYDGNVREGKWSYYNSDGTEQLTINYINGVAENQEELEKLESEELDRLEKNRGKFQEPTEESIFR